MKNKSFVFVLIFLLSFTSFLSLSAPASGGDNWIDIPALPYTITESGSYRLTESYSILGAGLSINASSVVVDGQNYLIQLTQTENEFAITIAPGCVDVQLRNINQTSSDYGVYAEEASFTVQNSFFTNNTSAGVFAFNSTGFTVQHSRLSNNSHGVVAVDSSGFIVTDCHLEDNSVGIIAVSGSNFTVENSYITRNDIAVYAQDSVNFTVTGSLLEENFEGGIETENCQFNIYNSSIINTPAFALFCFDSNFTIANSEVSNNTAGIYIIRGCLDASNVSLANNEAGLFLMEGNLSLQDCALDYNRAYGALFFGGNVTINDCSINNNAFGLFSELASSLTLSHSSIINNTLTGLADYYGNNTQIISNVFSRNGLDEASASGALMIEESNCTVTNNLFDSNFDALLLGIYNDELNTTQTYHSNIFTNNSFTFDFNYQLPSNYTNPQIHFYNNLVNDTAYVNPDSFIIEDQYAPPNTVFHLNTTFQAGARVYADGGRMIGGNYWAHPDGTGPSQTCADTDQDGFLDVPFDLFGNQTVYDYLPLSSNFVEYIDHLSISPQTATITAGTTVDYITTAYDQYGNAWNVSAQYTVDDQPVSGNAIFGYIAGQHLIQAYYNEKTAAATLTVTPASVDRFAVLVPDSATAGTPFTIRVIACDSYGNIVTDYTGTTALSINGSALSPSRTGDFEAGVWTGTVNITETGSFRITAADGNGHSGMSRVIIVNSPAQPAPTPPATIEAVTEDGSKVSLTITGNITSSQIANLTLSTNQTAQTTTLSFTLTGQSGDSGFSNITIAKNNIPYGTTPIVYIDGQQAPNQGYSQDSQNYYVWFTAHFSTHQVQIIFEAETVNAPQTPLVWYALAIVAIIVVLAVTILVSRRKHKTANFSPQ
jgi:nitrous oxidase accessory protein